MKRDLLKVLVSTISIIVLKKEEIKSSTGDRRYYGRIDLVSGRKKKTFHHVFDDGSNVHLLTSILVFYNH